LNLFWSVPLSSEHSVVKFSLLTRRHNPNNNNGKREFVNEEFSAVRVNLQQLWESPVNSQDVREVCEIKNISFSFCRFISNIFVFHRELLFYLTHPTITVGKFKFISPFLSHQDLVIPRCLPETIIIIIPVVFNYKFLPRITIIVTTVLTVALEWELLLGMGRNHLHTQHSNKAVSPMLPLRSLLMPLITGIAIIITTAISIITAILLELSLLLLNLITIIIVDSLHSCHCNNGSNSNNMILISSSTPLRSTTTTTTVSVL
jgi:hypothetical protein